MNDKGCVELHKMSQSKAPHKIVSLYHRHSNTSLALGANCQSSETESARHFYSSHGAYWGTWEYITDPH